jgi:tetratricopeptide (TPR) repeat protein
MTAWLEQVPPEEGMSIVITAYKLRIDDAYAAVGMMRGGNKTQKAEYANEPWCQPAADFRRFIESGSSRGALPSWWTSRTTAACIQDTPCVLGYALARGSVEPVELLQLDGSGELLRRMRDLGDSFEGPPPWGLEDRGPRDAVKWRTPLVGRKDDDTTICPRCRAGIDSVAERGIGHVNPSNAEERAKAGWKGDTADSIAKCCPFCGLEGFCPKCDGAVEAGCCVECKHSPTMYILVTSLQPRWARHAAKLAAPLRPPELRWFAQGDTPSLVDASVSPRKGAFAHANTDDHLASSRCPEMRLQTEATHMFLAGVRLLEQAFGVDDANRSSAAIQTKLQELSALAQAAQDSGEEPEPPVLAVDDSVTVHGLRAAPQHNGVLGVVESELVGGRHAVALGPGPQAERLKVRPSALPYHYPDRAHSTGLTSRSDAQIKPANLRAVRSKHFDVGCLHAGAQLIGDAFLAESKSNVATPAVCSLMMLAVTGLGLTDYAAGTFVPSAYAFYIAAYRMVANVEARSGGGANGGIAQAVAGAGAEARRFVDSLLEIHDTRAMRVTSRDRCVVHQREAKARHAQLMLLRSFDKLTRLGDMAGAVADLDLCIASSPDSRHRFNRVPIRLNQGNLRGAKEDLKAWLLQAHGDDRYLAPTLYAYAAMAGQDGRFERGQRLYERALKAERRHRHLFGKPQLSRPNKIETQPALDSLGAWAHMHLATEEQRSQRLRAEVGELISADELSESIASLVVAESADGATEPPATAQHGDPAIAVGDSVIVHGLRAAPQHNGMLGVVESGLVNGRIAVALAPDGATKLNIKLANVRLASAQSAAFADAPTGPAIRLPSQRASESDLGSLHDMAGQAAAAMLKDPHPRDGPGLVECRAAIAACTDEQSKADTIGDGDQSFVRAAMESDKGMRLKRARNTGMDYNLCNLSTFARACAAGDLATVEEALALVRRKPKALRELLERRELLLRFTPLLCCIAGGQRMQPVDLDRLPPDVPPEQAAALRRQAAAMRTASTNGHRPAGLRQGGMQHVAVARVLLDAGASANAKDVAGFTPFHLSCDKDNETALQIAAMLPAYRGNPNLKNRFGAVPLIDATQGRQLRAVTVLVEAGADPSLVDDSSTALTAADLASEEYNTPPPEFIEMMARSGESAAAARRQWRSSGVQNREVSPFTLAATFPDARQLFSLANIKLAADKPPTCFAAGCERPAPKSSCERCRRAWYCSAACQKEHWKHGGHKEECSAASGERTRFHIVYDHPIVEQLRRQAPHGSPREKRFELDEARVVKLQLPLDLDMNVGAAPTNVAGYDRLRSRTFLILKDGNQAFEDIVHAIRTHGLNGGAKGYFTAWGASEDGEELDIDVRCMAPAKPF